MQKTYNLGFDNVTQYPEVLENTTAVRRSIIFIVLHLVSMQSFARMHCKLMERENPKLANFTKQYLLRGKQLWTHTIQPIQ